MTGDHCGVVGCTVDAAHVLTVLSSSEPSIAFCDDHIVSVAPALVEVRSKHHRLRQTFLLELDSDDVQLIVERYVKDSLRLHPKDGWPMTDPWIGYRRGRTVSKLARSSTGRWLLRTPDASHVWDLDRGTYLRTPDPADRRFDPDRPSRPFEHDGIELRITRVSVWPTVGETTWVWCQHPADPASECFRRSRKVLTITEMIPLDIHDR